MSSLDVIIRNGLVVTGTGTMAVDVGIADGKIAAVSANIVDPAKNTIDATGLHVFPGVIDAHVHFNEPGRADWEGIETGSRATAAGGGTLFFDMPLNAHPPTLDAASFRLKQSAAEAKSLVDFALWGGLVPQNLNRLGELAECGVIGFKAFMCNSGIGDFSSIGKGDLREAMKQAAALRLPVAVHAESEELTSRLTAEAGAAGRTGVRAYLETRPIQAELDAIACAIELAGETGCALQIVHVSCARGVRLIAEAINSGVDVSCETCPHYLALTEDDMETLGAAAKCAPPLRNAQELDDLWQELLRENILTVGSDHSPSPPEMKRGTNFFKVWGGISGAQHLLPLLLTHAYFERKADLSLLARLTSANVAKRFKLPPGYGHIAAGSDANLALVNLAETFAVEAKDLCHRHPQSPYLGRCLRGKVMKTFLRGQVVFDNNRFLPGPKGKLIRPAL